MFNGIMIRNDKVAVTTTSTVIVRTRASEIIRTAFIIRNTSSNDADIITIALGQEVATSNKGIVLRKNESWSDSSETGYQCHQGQISAVCETANGQLSIMEK